MLGDLRKLEKHIDGKVSDWAILASHIGNAGMRLEGLCFVEIGTGWIPTLPLCFALAGARRCATYDLSRHINPRLTDRLVHNLEQYLPTICEHSHSPPDDVRSRHDSLIESTSLDELLSRASIEYKAPADATATGLADNSVDVVYSNSVLEHVPPDTILALFKESRRILKPGGIAVHSVGCNDHYRHFDRSISPINYLRYTESRWRLWNNKLQFQNRLRPRDFLELAQTAGLTVVFQKSNVRKDLMDALPQLQIAPEFRKYPPEQLCATSLDFVARKE